MKKLLFVSSAVFLFMGVLSPLSLAQVPIISDIEGSDSIEVLDSTGAENYFSEGEFVEPGYTVKTNDKVTVALSYDNGMQVHVAENSEYTVDEPQDSVPYANLLKGQIRSFIKAKSGAKPQKKLLIQSRAAVVGVRGTDFFVEIAGDETMVSTLSGQVEVASSLDEMRQGKIQKIGKGRRAKARLASGLISAEKFDLKAFNSQFAKARPRLAKLKTRSSLRRAKWKKQINQRRKNRRKRLRKHKRKVEQLQETQLKNKVRQQKRMRKRRRPPKHKPKPPGP